MLGTPQGEKKEAGAEGAVGAKERMVDMGQMVWGTHHVGSLWPCINFRIHLEWNGELPHSFAQGWMTQFHF